MYPLTVQGVTVGITTGTGEEFNTPRDTGVVARNYIFSLIWIWYGPKRDVLDYWGTILYCLLSYSMLLKDKGL